MAHKVLRAKDGPIANTSPVFMHRHESCKLGIALNAKGVGLGIGLTVVRELVEGHGGQVVASSAGKGLGSQFTITLPLPRG